MKLIVISQRIDEVKSYEEIRDALDEQWHVLFQKMNAILLPIPNAPDNLLPILDRVNPDAIVLSGGNNPVAYGGKTPQRDKIDQMLISYAVQRCIPLLGVCRGMQSIVLYFDGALKKVEGHVAVNHMIKGKFIREVNSYHSYAVDKLGNDFNILARDESGVIEAIEHQQYPIYGIMWHPERIKGFDQADIEWIREKLLLS